MSSLWTPDGERPARGERQDAGSDDHQLSEAEVAEQMEAVREQLARTPAAAVVANHCYGLFELAALHLSMQPPQLAEASVAIDALAAVVEGLPGRLGEHEPTLKEGLAQLRLAFVQIRAADLGESPPEADAPSGGD